ncbi:MAG: hypothetical protein IRZ32_16035 [Solirubrobacteraceae bacterium]|nr:hypothetical protein [Solirubrobacteraceae bacterium]
MKVFHPGQQVKVAAGTHAGKVARVDALVVRDRAGRERTVRFAALSGQARGGVRAGATVRLSGGQAARVIGLRLRLGNRWIGRYRPGQLAPARPTRPSTGTPSHSDDRPTPKPPAQEEPKPTTPTTPTTPSKPSNPGKPWNPGRPSGGSGSPGTPSNPGTTPSQPDPDPQPQPEPQPQPQPQPEPQPPADSPFVFGGGNWPGAGWSPYNASSPFNTRITNPVVHPQSSQLVANSLGAAGKPRTLLVSPAPSHDYQHPIYYATASDPLMTIQAGSYALTGRQIRVPANAIAAGGGDGHMSIVQPDGWAYELWQVSRSGSTLKASTAYRQRYDGAGVVTPEDVKRDPTIGGATAPYFGLHAGIIRASELAAGRIDHALFVTIPAGSRDTSFGFGVQAPGASGRGGSGSFVWPAFKGDAAADGVRPPMGTRFWLDMTDQEIAQSGAPAWEQAIARAVANYGAYFGDTGGDGFAFQAESSVMYTSYGKPDPYAAIAAQYGIRKDAEWGYGFAFSGRIPWSSRLRAIAPPARP